MKITIHEEKNSHFTFHEEKKGPITSHESTLYHPPLRRECGIACMNLNLRTDCIMLAMLERMRLTYCVLPKGKALNVREIGRAHV